ncbi:NAD(P)-dependent alcohol dehydrogenase [Actinomadura sp. ATCC 31491]|uniref:NAD(P)-dependent alcohol dehydrogenase n=1 Tax=Actinomadura luzonensis TaxID=2805427 RepID=A0ABT0FV42_9ACTN|nr:NAD(P)-dependent alcohol dehydrogenase [Actinomadura luzonensis]MCK2215850.1 NAD(P)-dependent alcohol dehydrogenase [Actinomadura luzonensis]
MKAFVLDSYGPPDALKLTEVPRPVPGPGEVLVRVRATSVQPFDWHLMRGEPRLARLMPGGPGILRPSLPILGADVAGVVEELGPGVREVAPGDEVYAMSGQGGFGEYAAVRVTDLAPKPATLSFEEAAAVPMAAQTALLALRDDGGLREGQRVLVNGASGGVGTFAVQLAKAFGGVVTGVCSPANVDLVGSLGAGEVVDYTKEDLLRLGRRFDLVVDVAGSLPGRAWRRLVRPGGAHVQVGGRGTRWLQPMGRMFATMALAPFLPHRVAITTGPWRETRANLMTLTGFIDGGDVRPVIDRRYGFAEIPAAVRYQEEGHARGKVVVTVAP